MKSPRCYLDIHKDACRSLGKVGQTLKATHRTTADLVVLSRESSHLFSFLKFRGLDNSPVLVAYGLAATEHLEPLDLLCIVVEVLAFDFL